MATVNKAVELVSKATEEDKKKNYEEALKLYKMAIEHFAHAIKYDAVSNKSKESMREKCDEYLKRAEAIKKYLNEKKERKASPEVDGTKKQDAVGNGGEPSGQAEKKVNTELEKFEEQLKGSILIKRPQVCWDDVAGLDGAKAALQETVILPERFPHVFKKGNRRPWKGILLYGPPGTGKSKLAEAVATEATGSTFISVSAADIVSKWLGESEKMVRSLFGLARKNRPSIIFIDEIDALCSARSDSESESARRIKTEFLTQMDGVGLDNEGILVLGATNLPWGLDIAFRRRLERKIYIPLPDAEARSEVFRIHVGATPNSLTEEDFRELGRLSEGYAGADIQVAVVYGLMEPVRKSQRAKFFKKVSGPSVDDPNVMASDLLTPCLENDPDAISMTLKEVPNNKFLEPLVSMEDLVTALEVCKRNTNSHDLEQLEEFTQQFGSMG